MYTLYLKTAFDQLKSFNFEAFKNFKNFVVRFLT